MGEPARVRRRASRSLTWRDKDEASRRGESTVASIHDVAAYVLDKDGPMTAMKLQKLCYFAYGYHLAWEDAPLFPERFQAWANGPVVPELYARHRGRFNLSAGEIEGNPDALTDDECESIDVVLDAFRAYTAQQLSNMTHREGPWVQARQRAGAESMSRSTEWLLAEDIAEYFGALVAEV